MIRSNPKIHTIENEAQRRAISSPLRMEILGHFSAGRPLSVREVAERMGRPATAVHYHVGILVESGLLNKSGERRDGRRREAEYTKVAEAIGIPSQEGDHALAVRTTASGFRMAEREMEAALAEGTARREGDDRNFLVTRVHLRLSKKEMAEINQRLDAVLGVVLDSMRRQDPGDDDEFVSLTLSMLPLPNRSTDSS
jgi:DNA-binding Lrp family transcriptional regulator